MAVDRLYPFIAVSSDPRISLKMMETEKYSVGDLNIQGQRRRSTSAGYEAQASVSTATDLGSSATARTHTLRQDKFERPRAGGGLLHNIVLICMSATPRALERAQLKRLMEAGAILRLSSPVLHCRWASRIHSPPTREGETQRFPSWLSRFTISRIII